MRFPAFLLSTLAFLTATTFAADLSASREYHLITKLKPKQSSKSRYNNLYLSAYHTGAGENDAVLTSSKAIASKGFLNGTNGAENGITYHNQVFDLGSTSSWVMIPDLGVDFYSGWQPVVINAGSGASVKGGSSGFWINGTGLQWTNSPSEPPSVSPNAFGGWLVCDWWHGDPQLFFRIATSAYVAAPCSCADVDLIPQYL